jgi:lipopolysaccharide biosynthesis regulator YciM
MSMELATLQPIQAWQTTTLPRVTASDWDPTTAHSALKELKRLRGELDAASAVLVSMVSASSGRDTKATVVRELGVSQAEAGRITRTAKVVAALHGIAEAIAAG